MTNNMIIKSSMLLTHTISLWKCGIFSSYTCIVLYLDDLFCYCGVVILLICAPNTHALSLSLSRLNELIICLMHDYQYSICLLSDTLLCFSLLVFSCASTTTYPLTVCLLFLCNLTHWVHFYQISILFQTLCSFLNLHLLFHKNVYDT